MTMNVENFQQLLKPVTDYVSSQAVDSALAENLNRRFPQDGETFTAIEAACHELSVDVVDLKNIVGPHHRHPTGEICMIMPVTEGARFDGMPRGWCVFEPGSDHRPTVTHGQALVLYMLPDGKIEFTDR
jgi:hypothetical protein